MTATLHIRNARIWTGDQARPWAASISIRDGRVEALDAEPSCEFTSEREILDAQGRTIVPGLIDSHMHLLDGGSSLSQLDLSKVASRAEFEAAIAQRHADLPADQWLIAYGWSQQNWPGNELPSKDWLAGVGARPAVCWRMDRHVALVNNAVLDQCDLQREPPGGRIVREPHTGEPTGLMIESAAWQLVDPLIPSPSTADRQRDLLRAQAHAHSMGITAVGPMEHWRDVQEVFAPIRDQLTLRCRVTLLDEQWTGIIDSVQAFANDDRLAIIGFKSFLDGTMGSRTARLLADYSDDPGNRGLLLGHAHQGCVHRWIHAVAEQSYSPSMHAIGDEAARLALDAIDSLPQERRRSARPRIEHAQQIDPLDIPRFADRIASMQPLHKADDGRYLAQRVGQSRLKGSFAFRSLHEAGALLAFGSDWPVVTCDPIAGIRAAVTGLTLEGQTLCPDQNLSVEEALRAYTTGAAHALGMDDAGTLRPGAAADLVILDRDPFITDWTIRPPRVLMTMAGGHIVYDARPDRHWAISNRQ